MEAQLPCRLPVSHSRQFIYPVLHMPTTYILLLDGLRADVRRERKELQEMVDSFQNRSDGAHDLCCVGL